MSQKVDSTQNMLQVADEFLATAQTIPQNTNAAGDEGFKEISGTLGALDVVFSAKTDLALASSATATFHLEDSADGLTSIADIPGASVTFTQESDVDAIAAGTILARIPVPSTAKRYVRCNIATNDAAATGTIDAFVEFKGR